MRLEAEALASKWPELSWEVELETSALTLGWEEASGRGGGGSKDIEERALCGPAPPLHTRVREGDPWGPSPKTAVGREAWEHWPHGRD